MKLTYYSRHRDRILARENAKYRALKGAARRNRIRNAAARAIQWQKDHAPEFREYKRDRTQRGFRELHQWYLKDLLARQGLPATTQNMIRKKLKLQLCRTRNLLKTMATSALLNP